MRSKLITIGTAGTARDKGADMIMVIDDHPLFCEALQMTLRETLCADQVTAACSLAHAFDLLRGGPEPDVIMLDLNLPDVAGLDGLTRLRNLVPGVPVVVVSSMADDRVIAAVMQAGAAGFVPKHSERDAFVAAIRAAMLGDVWLPDEYHPSGVSVSNAAGTSAIDKLAQLTPQQGRILALVCEGYLNKQIAHELSISETTVKAHVTAILRKLGVQSRTQAVRIANSASFASILQGKAAPPSGPANR